jgi:hypothetical protein
MKLSYVAIEVNTYTRESENAKPYRRKLSTDETDQEETVFAQVVEAYVVDEHKPKCGAARQMSSLPRLKHKVRQRPMEDH